VQCRVPGGRDTVAAVEIPELADLIWLFEEEPTPQYPDLAWPDGLQSFRLRRGDREVLFSLDPLSGKAYISLYATGQRCWPTGLSARQ
jgi:hypothetical protein